MHPAAIPTEVNSPRRQRFDHNPGKTGGSGSKLGRENRGGSGGVGGERTATIEAKPADPQHAGTGHGHSRVVWRGDPLRETIARPDQPCRDKGRRASRRMHDNAAGKVDRTQPGKPAAAPYPMGDRHIHQRRPNRREQNDETEPGTLGNGTDDQRRGDDRKRHLE